MLPVYSVRDVPGLYRLTITSPSPCFSQVFILNVVKVLCFDTLLQVLILKVVTASQNLRLMRVSGDEGSVGYEGKNANRMLALRVEGGE